MAAPQATNSAAALANQPWFLGAPVSKIISLSSAISYTIVHSGQATGSSTFKNGWTSAASKLTFGSTGEMVLGTFLLAMWMRRFEREMGSRRFVCFMAGTLVISQLLRSTLSTTLALGQEWNETSGPYPLLGAFLFLYHVYTPRLYPRFFGVLGFWASEKSMQYFLALQLMLYRGRSSLLPTVCGLSAAYLYMKSGLIEKVDLPTFIVDLFERMAMDEPPAMVAPRMIRQQRPAPRRFVPPQPQPQRRAPPRPDPTAVEQLVSMGFDRPRVLEALQATNNNVERAADRLLTGTN